MFLALAGTSFAAGKVRAQDMMRESVVGGSTSSSPVATSGVEGENYNLRVGPVRFSADLSAGFEFIDNINYSEVNRESDLVARFTLNLSAIVPLTRLNTLRFDLGIGFVRYIEHPSATTDDVFITPGSQVAFDVYVADIVRLNFRDSFDIRQDPVDAADLSGVTNFARFTNTAGVTATVDLNPILLTVGYDHFNYISLTSEFDYLNRSAEQFFGSISYQVIPRTFLGVDAGYSITNYDQDVLNDSNGGTVGVYVDSTINPFLRVIGHVGYQYASFSTGGVYSTGDFTDQSNLSTYFWSVTINHRINAYLTQSLSGGRETDLGLTSNFIKTDYVRYNLAWRALANLTLAVDGFYDYDVESGGPYDEHIDRYGGDVSLGYQFNMRMSGAVHYAYIEKDSDVVDRSYYQNRVGLDVNYRF